MVFYQVVPGSVGNGYGISTMSASGGDAKALLDTPANELHASLSPNGQWMAYASDQQSGRYEIFIQDFPAGTRRTQVSTNGGMQPKWRGDSKELYYLQSDGTLMSVAIGAGAAVDAAMPRALFKGPGPKVLDPYRSDYEPASDGQRFLMKVPASTSRPNAITVVLNWTALLAKQAGS